MVTNKQLNVVDMTGEFMAVVRSNSWWTYVGMVHYVPEIRSWVIEDSINVFRHPVNGSTGGVLSVAEVGLMEDFEWRPAPGVIIQPEASIAFIAPLTDVARVSIKKAKK